MHASPPPRAEFWIMPDLIGSSLTDAQGAIALMTDDNLGVRTTSMDATGQGRNGLAGAEWSVCWQSPESGEWIGPGSVVSFYVTLFGEESEISSSHAGTEMRAPARRRRIHPQPDD